MEKGRPFFNLIIMSNFGNVLKDEVRIPNTYTITYNRRKKRWQLNKKNIVVFSAIQKVDVEFWHQEVIKKNCLIF